LVYHAGMNVSSFSEQFAALGNPAERVRWLGAHRLLGPVDMLVERGLVPADIARLARPVAESKGLVSAGQLAEESRVFAGLVAGEVRALALKGCLLGHGFYPAPNQRWRADLDLLVSPDAVDGARRVLERLGYRPMWAVAGGTPMDQESWLLGEGPNRRVVDLHWGLRNHPILVGRLKFEEQWAASMELPGLAPGARGQGPVHALLNASMHWFDDLYDQRRPLAWLLDKDLLWRSLDQAGREELKRLAVERELAGLLAASLAMTRDVFDTPIQSDWLATLTEAGRTQPPTHLIRAASSPFRAYWFALCSEPGLAGKARRLRRSLFPPAAHMRQRYPEGSKFGLAGLYWRRIWRRV